MIKVENYPKAYREVYEILKFVPQEDVNKIPKNFIQMIEKNMNKEYNFNIDPNIDFMEEQELMPETNTILAYIFMNYWGTEEQKEKINEKLKKDLEEAENKKREIYSVDVFKKERKIEKNKTESNIIVYKKESLIAKIINKLLRRW